MTEPATEPVKYIPNDSEQPEEPEEYNEEDSNFLRYVKQELTIAGLFDSDSDYGGMIGDAVMELAKVFSKQGHSGFSAGMVAHLFYTLTKWEPLTPITDNPDEWMEVYTDLWQSQRAPSAFSHDGGKTYSFNDTPDVVHTSQSSRGTL